MSYLCSFGVKLDQEVGLFEHFIQMAEIERGADETGNDIVVVRVHFQRLFVEFVSILELLLLESFISLSLDLLDLEGTKS